MRTLFLIDGFNIYHSLKEASVDLGLHGKGTRWLNLMALCHSTPHLFGPTATLTKVRYFSAYATHLLTRDPDIMNRHKTWFKHTLQCWCIERRGFAAPLDTP